MGSKNLPACTDKKRAPLEDGGYPMDCNVCPACVEALAIMTGQIAKETDSEVSYLGQRIVTLVSHNDDRAVVDTVIWKTQDDDCVNRDYFPTLFQAVRKIKASGEPFVLFDGHSYFLNGVTRVRAA